MNQLERRISQLERRAPSDPATLNLDRLTHEEVAEMQAILGRAGRRCNLSTLKPVDVDRLAILVSRCGVVPAQSTTERKSE